MPEYQVHEYFGEILKAMNTTHRYYKLEAANKVYVKSGFELLDGFKRTIEKNYAGQLEAVDFTQSAETAKVLNCQICKLDKISYDVCQKNISTKCQYSRSLKKCLQSRNKRCHNNTNMPDATRKTKIC